MKTLFSIRERPHYYCKYLSVYTTMYVLCVWCMYVMYVMYVMYEYDKDNIFDKRKTTKYSASLLAGWNVRSVRCVQNSISQKEKNFELGRVLHFFACLTYTHIRYHTYIHVFIILPLRICGTGEAGEKGTIKRIINERSLSVRLHEIITNELTFLATGKVEVSVSM